MRLTKTNIEQVRQALNLFDNQGALDRLRKQSATAMQWDTLIAHHVGVFTGIEVEQGTVRHLRSEIGSKWYADGDPEELFQSEPKALLIVSSEDLGRLVDQAVEQALSCRIPETTIESEEIERQPEQMEDRVVEGSVCMVA